MKGFALNEKGDLVMDGGDLCLVDGADLLCQTVRQVLGTGRGEWFLNVREGVDRKAFLCKNPNLDYLQNDIQLALLEIGGGLVIQRFSHRLAGRTLEISFEASGKEGESVLVEKNYG